MMYLLSKNEKESLQNWLKDLKEFQLDNIFDTSVLAKAYLYTNAIIDIEKEENSIKSKIGIEHTYQTTIINQKDTIYGNCTCPFEGKCKHLAALVLISIQK